MTEDEHHGEQDLEEFSAEEQLELLRSNTIALQIGTMSFLKAKGIEPGEWVNALGGIFALGWDTSEPWSPEEFLDATIVNLTTFGGESVQAEYGDDEATAAIEHFPDVERLEGMGLDDVDGDLLFDMIGPIAVACGLSWSWRREGEQVRVRVVPGSAAT